MPQCGKTRLLEILELVVFNSRRASNISEAALFRVIEKFKPTLMLDEAETLKGKSERAEYLRQILNAGNRQGAVRNTLRRARRKFRREGFFCVLSKGGLRHWQFSADNCRPSNLYPDAAPQEKRLHRKVICTSHQTRGRNAPMPGKRVRKPKARRD